MKFCIQSRSQKENNVVKEYLCAPLWLRGGDTDRACAMEGGITRIGRVFSDFWLRQIYNTTLQKASLPYPTYDLTGARQNSLMQQFRDYQ